MSISALMASPLVIGDAVVVPADESETTILRYYERKRFAHRLT